MIINPDWFSDEIGEESVVSNYFRGFISNIDDAFGLFPQKFTFADWAYIFGCDKTKAPKLIDALKKITSIYINESGIPSFRIGSKYLFTNDFCVDFGDLEKFGIEYYSEIEPTHFGKFIYSIKDYSDLIDNEECPWYKSEDWEFEDSIVNFIYNENRPVSVDEISFKLNLRSIDVFKFAFELDFLDLPIWKRAENGTILLFPINLISENDLKILGIDSNSINSARLGFVETKIVHSPSHGGAIIKFIESAGRKVSIELISKELGLDIFYLLRFIFTYNLWGHHIKMEVAGNDILLYKYSRKTRHTMV